jgi:hypothetical protein
MGNLDKVISLARKLKALAEQGIGGEKENADAQLKRLLKKYNLTIEEIEGEKLIRREFFYNTKEKDLFIHQIIGSVIGKKEAIKRGTYSRYGKKHILVDLANTEYIEVAEKIEFFWKHYQEEKEIFYSAFIQKNQLFSKPEEEDEDLEEKELSTEEEAKLFKMFNMMEGMEQASYFKRLNS